MSCDYRQILPAAVRAGCLDDQPGLAGFVDINSLSSTIASLHKAFPAHFVHTFAAKANTMSSALAQVKAHGMGCEVASPGELEQAIRAGFEPDSIVYDEPAKTQQSLERVLGLGISLNIDNFQEFERVRSLVQVKRGESRIGFRINPQVGAGKISAMSTATATSKFGFALEDEGQRRAIVDCYRDNGWLTSLHTHVGSQGCSLELLCDAATRIQALKTEIETETGRSVSIVDMGGGLPTAYVATDQPPTFEQYVQLLGQRAPELIQGQVRLMTEFGRAIQAGCGIAFSRVEYVREIDEHHCMAVIHLGADFLLRPVYRSEDWQHEYLLFDATGQLKTAAATEVTIAGPLCFAGDILDRKLSMPRPEPGDWIAIRDVGGYTLGMWSRHCSRGMPAVVGYQAEGVRLLRPQETPGDIARFWSRQP